ncbi:fimbria/pilus outer membrane usher protein [uncultured Cedecea sp.]|uniref:fimbria/pilus outer membrane usher protein n=1 Tax=uncultured Cedecea sp. TaxID=988762 RepID=UPI00261F9786|nr:fimbria/pilus outer membrane usher protein [uncultured Cedecea sp.]
MIIKNDRHRNRTLTLRRRCAVKKIAVLIYSTLFMSSLAFSEDYFDPGFLLVTGEKNTVDLSVFSEAGGMTEGKYTLNIVINQRDAGQYTLNFIKNKQGAVTPELTPDLLSELGVNVENIPAFKHVPADKPVDDLTALIPKSTVRFDMARLELLISVPQVAMKPDMNNIVDPSLFDNGIPAFLMNYTLSGGRSEYNQAGIKSTGNTFFALAHSGINIGPWRLRSSMSHSYSDTRGSHADKRSQRKTTFSNTYVQRDIVRMKSNILAGEGSTNSDIFDSILFRGVKLATNTQMSPSQLQGFSPAIEGVANSSARIVVRQNGNVIYETLVAAGPFRINNIPQSGLSGDYQVAIIESNGETRNISIPYSSLPIMKRPGSFEYEVTAGQYNSSQTTKSRGTRFLLGTLTYGLPKAITLYGGAIISNDYQSVNIGSGLSLGAFGAFSADITSAIASLNAKNNTGNSYRLRYSKSMLSTGTTFDLTALRYSTKNFYTFNEFNNEGFRLNDYEAPWTRYRKRSSFQTSVRQQLGDYGNIGLRLSKDDYWGNQRSIKGMSLSYNNSYKSVSYSMSYDISRLSDYGNEWAEDRRFSLNISIPLSVFSYSPALNSAYVNTSLTRDNNRNTVMQTGISGSAVDNKLNYHVSQSLANRGQNSSNLNLGWQGDKGNVNVAYGYTQDSHTYNINASGGLVVHGDGITLSRTLGDSVALISAPHAPGVSDLGHSAKTDSKGYAVVPYLTSYQKNKVSLDPSTLPDGVDVTQSDINVYPTSGAVVRAGFDTKVGHQLLITLRQGGAFVPFGAIATLTGASGGHESSGIVGDDGQVYLSGLPDKGTLNVSWGNDPDRQCRANFDIHNIKTGNDFFIKKITVACS